MNETAKDEAIRYRELKIVIAVNELAENFYKDATDLGDHAAYVIRERHRSQMTGLENIAESAFKTSDIFDYVKRQTARQAFWRQSFPPHSDEAFGERLLRYLDQQMTTKCNTLCGNLQIADATDEDKQLRRHIYLQLIRQFIRQMVVQYEYRVSYKNDKRH